MHMIALELSGIKENYIIASTDTHDKQQITDKCIHRTRNHDETTEAETEAFAIV